MQINSIDVSALVVVVMVVSIETIGVVQFLKNFIKPKSTCWYAILSFLLVSACSLINTSVPVFAVVFNVIFLSLAVTQLAWDVVVKGVPEIVGKAFSMGGNLNETRSK